MGARSCLALSTAAFFLAWCAAAVSAAEVTIQNPQPDEASLRPGLAVSYYYDLYRHVDHVAEEMAGGPGIRGEPLPALDYRVGTGLVLTADRNDGVGAHIHGLIHLDTPGTYQFALESNDGVRLRLGGETLLEDPGVHTDQWSDVASVEVHEPGWYPFELLYFERQNTATLRLVWKDPAIGESGKFVPVPASAFAHTASE